MLHNLLIHKNIVLKSSSSLDSLKHLSTSRSIKSPQGSPIKIKTSRLTASPMFFSSFTMFQLSNPISNALTWIPQNSTSIHCTFPNISLNCNTTFPRHEFHPNTIPHRDLITRATLFISNAIFRKTQRNKRIKENELVNIKAIERRNEYKIMSNKHI
jgi:hypothetical protein